MKNLGLQILRAGGHSDNNAQILTNDVEPLFPAGFEESAEDEEKDIVNYMENMSDYVAPLYPTGIFIDDAPSDNKDNNEVEPLLPNIYL